jgi:hypothetical protein
MCELTLRKDVKFTLYIDESGDFESSRGQWVVAGLLVADSYANSERTLTNKLGEMPRQLGLKSIKDFHLTEFRREFGHNIAVDMAEQVYKKLDSLPVKYHAIATINHTKSSLSSREKTYRLMLSDILATCETTIPDDQVITKLDLVVASRTIQGELQTSISNINQDIIQTLPIALEVDLATKGLIDLMGKNIKVHMDYANNSWGLVCADFLANLNYHNRRSRERNFLEELRKAGKYSLFESSGNFEVRRARVAERNGDYVLALYRWIIIGHGIDEDKNAKEAIQRLLSKVFTTRGTSGGTASFEALIEMLWRNHNEPNMFVELSNILKFFENEFTCYFENKSTGKFYHLLFRLRNFRLLIDNHLGRTVDALLIVEQQNRVLPVLVTNPEYFQMVLDFKITETETFINSLDLEKALLLAIDYSNIMKSYKEVWQLLLNNDELSDFDSSRAYIKSEMSLFRINVLCLGVFSSMMDPEIYDRFAKLESLLANRIDLSRFNNYQVMLLLKQHKPEEAVALFIRKHKADPDNHFSSFDLFWFLKAFNETLLATKEIDTTSAISILEAHLPHLDLNMSGHPMDLVLRELALLEYQNGNRTKAMKYISKSGKICDLGESEISTFLRAMINIHDDYINSRLEPDNNYFEELQGNVFLQSIMTQTIELPFFRKVRYFSIY